MNGRFPIVYLARHGETAWTITGQHTGLTDLPMTQGGEDSARKLAVRLLGFRFAKVFSSPLQRVRRTCELAGFGCAAEIDPDLVEWNYGDYEGRLTVDILKERPNWELFRDGCPGGESLRDIAARADRVVRRTRQVDGDVLLFSSGHFLRLLAARWIGMEAINAQSLMLSTASLSELSYETRLSQPAIRLWNDTHHLSYSVGQQKSRTEDFNRLRERGELPVEVHRQGEGCTTKQTSKEHEDGITSSNHYKASERSHDMGKDRRPL